MITKKRSYAALAGATVLAAAVLVRIQGAGAVNAANGVGSTSDKVCSIAKMAEEYGFAIQPLQANTGPSVPAFLDDALDEVQRLEPGAVVAEQTSGTLHSSQLPRIDGRTAIVLRLDGLAPRAAGGPQPAEGEAPDGVARPQLTVKCAVALFDATTGEFLVSMIDMVAPEQ